MKTPMLPALLVLFSTLVLAPATSRADPPTRAEVETALRWSVHDRPRSIPQREGRLS
jgi:hypothetical protein